MKANSKEFKHCTTSDKILWSIFKGPFQNLFHIFSDFSRWHVGPSSWTYRFDQGVMGITKRLPNLLTFVWSSSSFPASTVFVGNLLISQSSICLLLLHKNTYKPMTTTTDPIMLHHKKKTVQKFSISSRRVPY